MNKIYSFTILFLFLFASKSFSQNNITGKIINQDKKPVELIEVLLLTKDLKPMLSLLSDKEGLFSISAKENQYVIQIKQNAKILFNKELNLNKNIDLGIINIETIQMLKEVLIKTDKKIIEYKRDKLIFNVENSITASGGDVIDILKSTPNIIVQENNITMVGKSNASVMINNRLVQLSGEDLINMLKSITSENVSKIEVVNSPSAKYDSEGNSGLINIVLKKGKNDSYNGNIKSSYTQAKYDTKSLGGGINYQKNKLTVITNLDFSKGAIAPIQKYDIYYPTFRWNEIYTNKNIRDINNQRIALDYKVSKKTVMGFDFNRISNKSKIDGINESKINSTKLDSIIETNSFKRINRHTNTLNIHSLTTLDTLGKSISFDFDYLKYDYYINNDFDINTFLSNGEPKPNRNFFSNNDGNQLINIYSAKMDFVLPLKFAELSIGFKTSFLNNDNETLFYNKLSNQYFLDKNKSNHFIYDENNNAVYISAEKDLTEKWFLQLGLRVENTITKSNSIELNQINKNKYTELFPNLYISYKTNKGAILSVNYNRRIERPAYNLLNPFRVYSTNQNYTSGNPFLLPFFSNNVNFSFRKNNFNHSVFFNYINNGIDQVTFVDGFQRTRPINFYTNKKIGLSENYNFQKNKVWEGNNGLTIFYIQTNSSLKETLPTIKGWTIYFTSANNFTLNKSKTLKAELNFVLQTNSVSNSYTSSTFSTLDTGIKYSMLKNNLLFSLNITDLYKGSGITFSNNVNNIVQEKFTYSDTQKFRVSLLYKFGKSFKENKRNTSNEEEKNRVK